jgi:hypothetical protein
MIRVVEVSYVPLQSCVVVLCKSSTLSDETCNFIYCSPIKKHFLIRRRSALNAVTSGG